MSRAFGFAMKERYGVPERALPCRRYKVPGEVEVIEPLVTKAIPLVPQRAICMGVPRTPGRVPVLSRAEVLRS